MNGRSFSQSPRKREKKKTKNKKHHFLSLTEIRLNLCNPNIETFESFERTNGLLSTSEWAFT